MSTRKPKAARWIALAIPLLLIAGCSSSVPAATPTTAPSPTPGSTTPSATIPVADSGLWLAYEWFGTRDHKDVTLIHPDGTGVHALATDIESDEDHGVIDWAPDGKSLVFSTGEWYFGTKIWSMDADGANLKMLIGPSDECRMGVNFPAYSMDGTKLLYVCDDGLAGDDAHTTETLMVLDLASNTSTRVATFTLPDELLLARWSPDGKSAVVELNQWELAGSEVKNIGSLVAVVTIADGTTVRLTEPESWAGSPDWSWANGLITYGTYGLLDKDMTSPSAIYTVQPDGTELTQIPTDATNGTRRLTTPRWTPDGSQIIVSLALGHGPGIDDVKIGLLDLDGTLTQIPAGDDTRSGVAARMQPTP